MQTLRTAGEKLCKFELEKRHAIEMEDYERARHKKNQIDEYRTTIYQLLAIDQLLEVDGKVCKKNDEYFDESDQNKGNVLSPTLVKRVQSPNQLHPGQVSPMHCISRHHSPKTGSPSTGSPTNIQQRGSFRRRNKSAGAIVKSTYEMYEDKPLPALRQ